MSRFRMWHAAVIAFVVGVLMGVFQDPYGLEDLFIGAAIALGVVSAVNAAKSPGARIAYGAGIPAALIATWFISDASGLFALAFLVFVAAVWVIVVTILHAAKVAARRAS